MFIDIHAHAYLYPGPPQDGRTQFCTPEQLLELHAAEGIEKALLLPLIGPEVYLPQSNEEILEVCRRWPEHFVACCNLDPRGIGNHAGSDFTPWLHWYRDRGCRGVGEFMPCLPFDHPLVWNFFRQVEALEWPLTFDITPWRGEGYGLYDDPGLPRLERSLGAFPKLRIFGHGPAFWAEIGRLETVAGRAGYPAGAIDEEGAVPKLFRRCPNLWGDLSAGSGYNALARDEEYAAGFLTEFQDRLCFGTDRCSVGHRFPLAELLLRLRDGGKISPAVFRKIARDNAIRAFNLE